MWSSPQGGIRGGLIMKKIFFILLCAMCALTANAQTGTREMRITPLDGASLRLENGAWIIRLADIDSIDFRTINKSTTPDEGEGVEPDGKEHAYVDLGLPSGTLWATCNIGAEKPIDNGDYFAWGEVTPKEVYNWTTYKWCVYDTIPAYENELGIWVDQQINMYFTKYNTDASLGRNGFVDNKTVLDSIDDAAAVNWGGKWRMPTYDQIYELNNKCTWEWQTGTNADGDHVAYYKVTGPSGNSIYLPAAGYRNGSSLRNEGSNGFYWSSSLSESTPNYAYYLYFYEGHWYWDNDYRYRGLSVRPVCSSR